MSRRFMIKIISRLRTRKSATLVPVFCPWGQKMRRVWDAGFCADWGVGLFAAGRGKCGMGIMKRPLRRFAAAFFIVFTVPSGRGGPRR